MTTLRFQKITITASEFQTLPPERRGLFLLLGNAAMRIRSLRSAWFFAFNQAAASPGKLGECAVAFQISHFVTLLVGQLFETQKLLASQGALIQGLGLSAELQGARAKVNRLFANPMLANIRNDLAFHLCMENAIAYAERESQSAVEIWLADGDEGAFVGLSGGLLGTSLFERVADIPNAERVSKLLSDVAKEIAPALLSYLDGLMIELIGTLVREGATDQLPGVERIDRVRLPYFFERLDNRSRETAPPGSSRDTN